MLGCDGMFLDLGFILYYGFKGIVIIILLVFFLIFNLILNENIKYKVIDVIKNIQLIFNGNQNFTNHTFNFYKIIKSYSINFVNL